MSSELSCGHQEWEHELFDSECPPPPGPRECCGVPDEPSTDAMMWCEHGQCIEWYCGHCGVFTGMAAGPIGCGCKSDTGKYHVAWAERPMVPMLVSKKHMRHYRRHKPYTQRIFVR